MTKEQKEKIIRFRRKGLGYADIGRELDISKDTVKSFCRRNGLMVSDSKLIQSNPEWEYAGVYADSGISGTGIKERDEFQRLIDDCEAGKIDIVITKSISRFARNTVDFLQKKMKKNEGEVPQYYME